jgi:hypothetical protein
MRIEDGDTSVLCIAIRAPGTGEIQSLAMSVHELADKAKISIRMAEDVFQKAEEAERQYLRRKQGS